MQFFRNIWVMWKREMRGYFYTSLAYVFLGVFSLIMGVLFVAFLNSYLAYTQQSAMGMAPTITIDRLAEVFYGNMHVLLMFILPFFTMRLFTEESRQNTLALLLTSPVRISEIAIAKFKAAGTMLLLKLAVTLIFPLFLVLYSSKGNNSGPDAGIILGTYLGLILIGFVYLSIGLFWSSVTDSQFVALMMTFANIFGFWLLAVGAQGTTGKIQEVMQFMAVNEHFSSFAKGTIEVQGIVYLLSLVVFFIFLTQRSLESRAWRT